MPAPADLPLDTLLPHMRQVARCESSLQQLNLMWRLIDSCARMNCAQEAQALLPMMAATRAGFEQLEQDLVQSMVAQAVTGVTTGLASQAQHLIDTLVRNLYERTADVSFLAGDEMLCRFVAGLDGDEELVQQRLQAYQRKYTVYEDVLLLDAEGRVLSRAQPGLNDCEIHSADPLIHMALPSDSYVQTFGVTDLLPGSRSALIYAHRMLHPVTQQPAGVLCLCFDFAGEMQGLWDARQSGGEFDSSLALLVDGQNRVLASSDVHWIQTGTRLQFHRHGAQMLQIHAGRTYLVQSAQCEGYQGYAGPEGWRALLMVPLDLAFSAGAEQGLQELDAKVAQGLLAHARHFSPALHAIHTAASNIRRVVWNGQVMTAGRHVESAGLQAVLAQIAETGARTHEVFAQSIHALYSTVLATALQDSRLLTRLLVDLLDRNLYERANDCRWWALTPQLPALLLNPCEERVAQACELLTHIHGLYTVYRQIVVYDLQGRVLAASLRDASGQVLQGARIGSCVGSYIGSHIEADTLVQVLSLPNAQSYYVTPWRSSAMQGAEAGYTYHAAIRDEHGRVLGGIGLIFHTQRELKAMLQGVQGQLSSLPRHVSYLRRDGLVMSSTDPQLAAGSYLPLPADMLSLPAGHSVARVMEHQGQYSVVAVTAGSGYREFKRSDGYAEEVLAVAVQNMGAVQADAAAAVWRASTRIGSEGLVKEAAQTREMATFFVGNAVLAVDAACVLEAQSASALAPLSAGRLPFCVGTLKAAAGFVWVFDLGSMLGGEPVAKLAKAAQNSQVVVLEHEGLKLGLLVHDVLGVNRFASSQFRAAPAMAGQSMALVDQLIQAEGGALLIQKLHLGALVQKVRSGNQATREKTQGQEAY